MPRKKKPAIDYGERRQELIELLDSIAKDENTPARYRIDAVKQLNELLSQAEEIKQAEIREAERAELAKQRRKQKEKEELEAKQRREKEAKLRQERQELEAKLRQERQELEAKLEREEYNRLKYVYESITEKPDWKQVLGYVSKNLKYSPIKTKLLYLKENGYLKLLDKMSAWEKESYLGWVCPNLVPNSYENEKWGSLEDMISWYENIIKQIDFS